MTREIILANGDVWDWSDQPEQFCFVIDKKKAARLVRNASSVAIVNLVGDPVAVQKGGLMAMLSTLSDDDTVACIFNGFDLLMIGLAAPDDAESGDRNSPDTGDGADAGEGADNG